MASLAVALSESKTGKVSIRYCQITVEGEDR